jgi:AAA family ATP:ADP antiporter
MAEDGMPDGVTTAARGRALLARAVDARGRELEAALWAFAWFFSLLCGLYVLRPLREEMGIRGGVDKLQWLFTATFLAMLAAVPAFSALMARVPRSRAIPLVYRFLALCLIAFFAVLRLGWAPVGAARALFVWISVYNLFVVSVFWSFMADIFTSDQGKRLFGFVAAGGSAGALAGPAIAGLLVGPIGVANLVLFAAALLEASAWCVGRLSRWAREGGTAAPTRTAVPEPESSPEASLGGSAWSGIGLVFRSPYLLGIALQTLLFSLASTFLYFQQARIVAAAIPDSARRTALFAAVDLAVNVFALGAQSLATGRILAGMGLTVGLSLAPALSAAAFLAVAAAPTIWVMGISQALRRGVHYAVERPAREVLYTVVGREEKYKAKSFVDTVVYRGGDAASGWAYAGLSALGISLAGSALAAIPIAGLSLLVARWLAARHQGMERR